MGDLAFAEWLKDAERILQERYCIDFADAGLEIEYLEGCYPRAAPEEFINWFAEKYDLVPRTDWLGRPFSP